MSVSASACTVDDSNFRVRSLFVGQEFHHKGHEGLQGKNIVSFVVGLLVPARPS
jgi:hypothetical protein